MELFYAVCWGAGLMLFVLFAVWVIVLSMQLIKVRRAIDGKLNRHMRKRLDDFVKREVLS